MRFEDLSQAERAEIRKYGVTVQGMREAVESSLQYRIGSPKLLALGMINDAQVMIAQAMDSDNRYHIIEDQRQLLNRACWVLSNYVETQAEA